MAADHDPLLPIDIHYNKFLHWLVDRRRIPPKWAAHLSAARTLTRAAISATPDPLRHALQIPRLTAHQNLPYFTVRSYLQRLASDQPLDTAQTPPPPAHKDVLGRYKSPVLRAWADAAAAFEKRHVYLADAAQHLTHNTNNEATAIKSNIARLNQTLADFARREAQLIRSAADAEQRYHQTLHHYNLDKDSLSDFHSQLQTHLDKQLPHALHNAVTCVRSPRFETCVNYYRAFAAYVCHAAPSDLCTALTIVMDADMAALTALPEPSSPAPPVDLASMSAAPDTVEPSDSADAPIDWGIEIGESGTLSQSIEPAAESHSPQLPDAAPDSDERDAPQQHAIDWSAVMGDLTNSLDRSTTQGAQSLPPHQPATLASAEFRDQYLNDLMELAAFLAQRRREVEQLSNSEVALALQQSNSAPADIKGVDIDSLADMIAAVDEAILAINGAETRRLLALQSNAKLLERTAKGVLEKKHVAERTRGAIDVLRKQRAAAGVQLTEESASLERIAEDTRRIKKEAEAALSGLYGGRVVNIVGEINVVFAAKSV